MGGGGDSQRGGSGNGGQKKKDEKNEPGIKQAGRVLVGRCCSMGHMHPMCLHALCRVHVVCDRGASHPAPALSCIECNQLCLPSIVSPQPQGDCILAQQPESDSASNHLLQTNKRTNNQNITWVSRHKTHTHTHHPNSHLNHRAKPSQKHPLHLTLPHMSLPACLAHALHALACMSDPMIATSAMTHRSSEAGRGYSSRHNSARCLPVATPTLAACI